MTVKSSERVAGDVANSAVPLGLISLTVSIRVKSNECDFESALSELLKLPEFESLGDGKRIRGVVMLGTSTTRAHAHFFASQKGQIITFSYEIIRGEHGASTDKRIQLAEAIMTVRRHLTNNDEVRDILMGATFSLNMKSWKSTLRLPRRGEAIVKGIPGTPRIAGLDLVFSRPSEASPLRRAFITTYEALDELVIKFMLTSRCVWDKNLPGTALGRSRQQLSVFAKQKSGRAKK